MPSIYNPSKGTGKYNSLRITDFHKRRNALPLNSSSRFLAASSRCFFMIASLAKSALASVVLPAAWSF